MMQEKRKNNRKFIELRNRDIIQLFKLLGFKIRLVGNPEYPNFILNDEYKLPIRVAGNGIIISNKFNDSSNNVNIELGRGKLKDEEYIKDVCEKVVIPMSNIEKTPVYRVKMGYKLFLYDFKYQNNGNGYIPAYPLFSVCDPKILYTLQYAKETAIKLQEEGYEEITVVLPAAA